MTYVLLVAGFLLLIKGADVFVDGSADIAKKLKIPEIIVGLTIVAFGTSSPEAAVSISASLSGSNGLALGNVVGSNIFNILIVAGVCAVIKHIDVNVDMLKKDFPFSVISGFLLLAFCLGADAYLSRVDAIIFLALFIGYMVITVKQALKYRNEHPQEDADDSKKERAWWLSIILILAGGGAIVLGGNLVIDSSQKIAQSFGISDTLIGLTIVAMGTSLPELVTSIVAAKKSKNDMALGNVIGSNIFNILFILGTAALIKPIQIADTNIIIDMIIMNAVSIIVLIFAFTRKKINRFEGLIMAFMYIFYTAYIILREMGA